MSNRKLSKQKHSKNETLLLSTVINLASMVDILTSENTKDRDQKIDILRRSIAMDSAEALRRLGVDIDKAESKIETLPPKKILIP